MMSYRLIEHNFDPGDPWNVFMRNGKIVLDRKTKLFHQVRGQLQGGKVVVSTSRFWEDAHTSIVVYEMPLSYLYTLEIVTDIDRVDGVVTHFLKLGGIGKTFGKYSHKERFPSSSELAKAWTLASK